MAELHPDTSLPAQDLCWAFSTLGCAEQTLESIAALAREFRIPRVELRAIADRLDLPNYFSETFGNPARMAEWFQRARLEIVAFDSSAKLIDCPPAARDELLAFGEWANALGVPSIRVFDGGVTAPNLPPEDRKKAVAFIKWWNGECAARGWTVKLIVETHDALCTSAACLALSDALGGQLDLLWDSHHTWRKGGEDPEATWSAIRPLVRHIHFRDSIGEPTAMQDHTCTGLGEGQYPLARLFNRLRADQFKGPVCLEWERKWLPYLPPLSTALEQLTAYRRDL